MYTTPPPAWHKARNGTAPGERAISRGASPWRLSYSYPSAPTFQKLAYFSHVEGWGDRIPPAPVIGNPVSAMTSERLYNAAIEEGLGGFFDDVGRFLKKGVRYTGAATIGVVMPAGTRKRVFGLSPRASRRFETGSKVTRGVLSAAAGYKIGSAAYRRIRAARAPKSVMVRGRSLPVVEGKTLPITTAEAMAAKKAGLLRPGVTVVKRGRNIIFREAGRPRSILGWLGKGVGDTLLLGTVLGQRGRGVIERTQEVISDKGREFADEYKRASGQELPLAELQRLGDKISDEVSKQVMIRSGGAPLATGPFPGPAPVGSAQEYAVQEAGFLGAVPPWVFPAALGLLSVGVVFSVVRYRRKRR